MAPKYISLHLLFHIRINNSKGILLAYGRYTGGDTVYNNLSNGARVIEMTEGSTSFKTWIRLKGGEVINPVNYPSDFIKKKD